MDMSKLREFMEQQVAFNKHLGMKVVAFEPGKARLQIDFREEFIGDPMRRALHGGVLAALADAAGGMAVWGSAGDVNARVSTIDIRIDYLRPGKPEAVCADAIVVRQGNRVGVADMRMFHSSAESETIATGKAVYNIVVKSG
ncbi:MAG: thioesterase family protein [Deltaproteobacteria bacterium]|nr:thioesterase family protein [Deltaproteobacteria bacterium]